ncbi:MAG: SBBP repeat-containing protein, partial [Chloroflexales bacterium]|nr:SBBP repeat-containing protein [Chloroflexales bacterium]
MKQPFAQLALLLKVGTGFLFVCLVVGSLSLSHFPLEPFSLSSQSHTVSAPNSVYAPPLSFVPNTGQTDATVQFQAHSRSGAIFFTSRAVVVTLPEPDGRSAATNQHLALSKAASTKHTQAGTVVRLDFVGSNPHPRIVGGQQQAGVINYLLGNDPNEWYTDLSTYAEVIYQNLYPGIDLYYDGAEGLLKGTYVVAPEANPDRIRWRYAGVSNTQVDQSTGDLVITVKESSGGTLIEKAPTAWQEIQGQSIPVSTSYNLATDGTVSLAIGSYDTSYPLIIDPTLEYSSYLGGNGNDFGGLLERDNEGSLYIAGRTTSTDFPTTDSPFGDTLAGEEDGFVTKLRSDGAGLEFSTYFGGNGDDFLYGFALDSTGHMYISGETASTDLPGSEGGTRLSGESDGFVARLDPDGGSLDFGVYLGGSGTDTASGLAVDSSDRVYLVGRTTST